MKKVTTIKHSDENYTKYLAPDLPSLRSSFSSESDPVKAMNYCREKYRDYLIYRIKIPPRYNPAGKKYQSLYKKIVKSLCSEKI